MLSAGHTISGWGMRSFAVAGPSSWNVLPVGLRSSSFRYVCKTFEKAHSIWFSILATGHALLSLYYMYFVGCDTVKVFIYTREIIHERIDRLSPFNNRFIQTHLFSDLDITAL